MPRSQAHGCVTRVEHPPGPLCPREANAEGEIGGSYMAQFPLHTLIAVIGTSRQVASSDQHHSSHRTADTVPRICKSKGEIPSRAQINPTSVLLGRTVNVILRCPLLISSSSRRVFSVQAMPVRYFVIAGLTAFYYGESISLLDRHIAFPKL